MNTKLSNLSEMENMLSVKKDTCTYLSTLFSYFDFGKILRHHHMEKQAGISSAALLLWLCLFRIGGMSIYAACKNKMNGLMENGENTFYRMLDHPTMNWRLLLHEGDNSF